jgi:hypothetical protein
VIIDMLAIRCSDAIIDMLASRRRVRARALADPAVALLRSLAADIDAAPGLTARRAGARRQGGALRPASDRAPFARPVGARRQGGALRPAGSRCPSARPAGSGCPSARPAGAWPHAAAAAAVAAVLATMAAVAAAGLMLVGMLGRLVWGRSLHS